MAHQKKKQWSIFDGKDEVECYQIVMSGIKKSLPNGFWDKESAKILVRYLVLELKSWKTREQICKNLCIDTVREAGMSSAAKQFNCCLIELVEYCFPEFKIQPWELSCAPNGFWKDKNNCAKFLRWLVKKEKLYGRKKFLKAMNAKTFYKYGVGKAFMRMGGIYNLVNFTYPGEYKYWELPRLSKITEQTVRDATKWMIEEKYKWTFEEVCENITAKSFYDAELGSILCHGAKHSPFQALEITYPGVYKLEDLKRGKEHPFREKQK